MLKKIASIRYHILRMHVFAAMGTGILFFVGLQFALLFMPANPLGLSAILWLTGLVFIAALVSGMYAGYTSSQPLKDRLEKLSTFITVLSRGNLSRRMEQDRSDEIGRMSVELNGLAERIDSQVQSLQRLADEKAELAEEAHKAATIEERQRLARDLHDAVSQQLFALSMMSSAALRIYDMDGQKAKEQLQQISDMAAQAQVEMRALMLHLRPVHLSGDTLWDGLEKLIGELKAKCTIDFQVSLGRQPRLSRGVEDHLFRIIQEFLSNVLRHAEAQVVKLEAALQQKHLYIYISDDGKGFDFQMERKTSYGLKTMQERAEEIGASVSLKSQKGQGTYLTIRVPVKEEKEYGEADSDSGRG
ncbi:sensor histidine kinase [Bacillus marinisedimentorum]|uniref:sensor histidine kinase n=1 Tax=Bacillus marinisedimentorum TaxID=1821260 RepID=UPI0008724FF4|nr:sensor histidine kinase [Bacillus marinisedimentorum]